MGERYLQRYHRTGVAWVVTHREDGFGRGDVMMKKGEGPKWPLWVGTIQINLDRAGRCGFGVRGGEVCWRRVSRF